MLKPTALTALLLAFAASPIIGMHLRPNVYEGGRSKNLEDQTARNNSAFGTILGELRSNMADMMFIKTERYLHNGVGYVAHLDMDKAAQSGAIEDKRPSSPSSAGEMVGPPVPTKLEDVGGSLAFAQEFAEHQAEVGEAHQEEDDHAHEKAATLIPPAAEDFRGFVGALHRAVKPWQDPSLPHVHTDGTELLPWYRLMTISDPTNVRAYMIGAWWLKNKRQEKFRDEALKFLNEGISNNKRAFQLYMMRGYLLKEMDRRAEALESFRTGAELIESVRPVEGPKNPRWTDYQEDDARATARMAVFLEREIGDPAKALAMALRYNEILGGDGRLSVQIAEMQSGKVASDPSKD